MVLIFYKNYISLPIKLKLCTLHTKGEGVEGQGGGWVMEGGQGQEEAEPLEGNSYYK